MAVSLGTQIGAYEVLAPLGAGSMGEVYRARDNRRTCSSLIPGNG